MSAYYNQKSNNYNTQSKQSNSFRTNKPNESSTSKPVEQLTNDNYVDLAKNIMEQYKKESEDDNKKYPMITTSKIRNILAIITEIYNDIMGEQNEDLNEEIRGQINYLKVRIVYDAGREPSVKEFQKRANLISYIEAINGKRTKFLIFSRYMEALVAYRKFICGKDD